MSDRKASDLAPSLSSATGSADFGFHVMVKQARDRQFECLNAQQEALEDENGDEYWSNSQRGMTRMNYWIWCQCVAARKPKQ
jgi:hypothetical protein